MDSNLKPIFSSNRDIYKNAYMNWRTSRYDEVENLKVIGEGFQDAAVTMLETLLQDNSLHQADSLIFPILYSIDQSIELCLKAILNELDLIEERKPGKNISHDIKGLYHTMVSRIERKEKNIKGLQVSLKDLSDYIDELYEHIGREKPKLDFARYPFDTDRNPHFYVCSTENVVIDLENLLERFNQMMHTLDGIYLKYRHELEVRDEWQD